jgi:GNAT superfamily N-acetyltransferase
MVWTVEPLGGHRRDDFSCGNSTLDHFLHQFAGQYERRGLGRTFVAVGQGKVLGYYTLAVGELVTQELPPQVLKKFPRHPVPVVLLGRLAVDLSARGQGLGEGLLMDALRRCLSLSQHAGVHAVEVQAVDEAAKKFYQKYGFKPLADDPLHLYLPLKVAEQALAGH